MTDSDDADFSSIDQLVRAHVEREIGRVDSAAMIARIRSTALQPQGQAQGEAKASARSPAERKHPFFGRMTWTTSLVAGVCLAFLGGRYFNAHSANAAGLLRSVQFEHTLPADYCYRVQFSPDPRFWDRSNKLEGPSSSVLWTRGDRFWSECTLADWNFSVGREESGTVWISPSPNHGICFSNDDARLPKVVRQLCQINSMSVPRIINEVLADFELTVNRSLNSEDGSTLIFARLKSGRTNDLISSALLEVNSESNVLTRLVLWLVQDGHPRGTVTFSLLKSEQLGDEQYQLKSHLNADATIEMQAMATPDYQPELSTSRSGPPQVR